MKNLVPKSITKRKKYIYKKITWIDLLITLIYLIISICIPIGLIFLHIGFRLLISLFIFIILMLSMVFLKEQDCRIYEYIYRSLRFKINPKKYDKNFNGSELVPYKNIDENNVITIQYENNKLFKNKKEKLFSKIYKIVGIDLSILSKYKKDYIINEFKNFLLSINENFSLYKLDEWENVDTKIKNIDLQINQLFNIYSENKIDEKKYNSKLELLNFYKNELSLVDNKIIKQKNIYITLYANSLDELNRSINYLNIFVDNADLLCIELDNNEIINFYTKTFNPYQNNNFNNIDSYENIPKLLAFGNIDFYKDHFVINNKLFGSFFLLKDYPIVVNDFWIAELLFNNDANVSISFTNCDYKQSKKIINSALANASSESKYKKDFTNNENFEDLKILSEKFLLKQENFKTVNITFYTYSNSYDKLKDKNDELENLFFNYGIKIHKMYYLQIEGLLTYSAFGYNELIKKFGYDIPVNTIANGWPFLLNNLNDDNGLNLGIDSYKQSIWLDIFSNNNDRKNNNVVVYGQKGSGKTTLISKLIMWNYVHNKKIFIIDTNNNYKNICSYFSGDYIDIINGQKHINPLQIFNLENNDLDNITIVNNHLLMLESFFKIILKTLNDNDISILIYIIYEVYEKFNLTKKTKKLETLKAKQFPTFSDVYEYIKENWIDLLKKYEYNNLTIITNVIKKTFLKGGIYSDIWNQPTNLNFDNDFVVFNLLPMFFNEQNLTIIQGQIYLILNLLQQKLNDFSDSIIVIDELLSIIENNVFISTNYINNFSKLIAKNNGSLIVSIQQWNDNVNSNNFINLFNGSQYSFYMGQNPNSLKLLKDIYNNNSYTISKIEEDFLISAKSGDTLLCLSNIKRYQLNINLYKFEENVLTFTKQE